MKGEIKTKGGRWMCDMESTTKLCRSKGKGASCLIGVVFLAMTSIPIVTFRHEAQTNHMECESILDMSVP